MNEGGKSKHQSTAGRGRGCGDLNCLLLTAQRWAATKTEFIVIQKVAKLRALLDLAQNQEMDPL
jgi:hypothetical protein